MKLVFILMVLFCCSAAGQQHVTRSIKDFGAKGNGYTDDHDAFVKASSFFNKRKGHGTLVIPKGVYIIGRQKFTGGDKGSASYTGEYVIDINGCSNFSIIGKTGAILKCRKGLRIGSFDPRSGKAFRHTMKDINIRPEYLSYRSSVGITIHVSNSSMINISGLALDGNFDSFVFGGNWGNGRNPYELIHYGIYVIDSDNIALKNCSIKKFACDGIYIANRGKEVNTHTISIDQCNVNYCGRNGLSWLGGENIRVTNSVFSNSGQGRIHESPAAGIDIEVENNSFCRKGYFFNCTMLNNIGSAITSGSKDLSSDVLFRNCVAASPNYYTVFVDAPSHIFEDCRIYGTTLVWHRGSGAADAVKFRRCTFDENYQGKKMYDGSYQFGAEATAVEIDSCIFKAYSTSSYYLASHTKDCSTANPEKIKVSNSVFYNYAVEGLKLAPGVAGMAGHTSFYNNHFYSKNGVVFQNGFSANCNADAGKNKFHLLK